MGVQSTMDWLCSDFGYCTAGDDPTQINFKKEKVMKSVNELRIPAYAVVNAGVKVDAKKVVHLAYSREEGRVELQDRKTRCTEYNYKLLKLAPEKWIR